MMQSAPIRRAAATVFSRCWATSVSTVGTPVMSMIAIVESGLDDPLEQALHHDLRAGAVERADQRQREDAVPQLHDRRRELEQLLLLAADDLLARCAGRPRSVNEAELVEQHRRGPHRGAELVGVVVELRAAARSNSGCLSEKTNVAVSVGVKPLGRARPGELGEQLADVRPRRRR